MSGIDDEAIEEPAMAQPGDGPRYPGELEVARARIQALQRKVCEQDAALAAKDQRIQCLLEHTTQLTNEKRAAVADREAHLSALLATAQVAGKLAALFSKS